MRDLKDDRPSARSRTDLERPLSPRAERDAELLPAGTVLAGRYEVRQVIGRGGMGVVVEAFDRTLGVAVAIKILRGEYAAERAWSERLAREVKLARQLQHPNVCRVFDYAQADGWAFLIMELAGGGTLRDEIGEGATRALPLAARLDDARAIASGLAAIHAAGIVHRDISPQNALRMSDGRLVLSDFGLATDSLDGSTSIHGGTVAYMAPEVLRGGRAGFASDIWSLGAVIHETVFGERLAWDPDRKEMRSAIAGRKLTRVEAGVLEICRACMASNPERRPRGADAITAELSEAWLGRAADRRRRRRAGMSSVAALLVVAAVGGARHLMARRKAGSALTASSVTAAPADPLMIVPTGVPEDWTDKSKVLTEVPERIRCMVPLPDHHTIRFVWGYPPHAVDLDTRTGKRVPSPLVPAAYAEGCPDLSRDGKRLVYAGHTSDDRAFAFVSTHPDGSDGIPEVQTGEPTMNSDPVWLPDGDSFVYDIDDRHEGLFCLANKHSEVIPDALVPVYSSAHTVVGGRVVVASIVGRWGMIIGVFSVPRLEEVVSFHLARMVLDLQSPNGRTYYGAMSYDDKLAIVSLNPADDKGTFVGEVRDQSLRAPLFIDGGTAFISYAWAETLVLHSREDGIRRVPVDSDISWAAKCGKKIIATVVRRGVITAVWLDFNGRVIEAVKESDGAITPTCSSDGRTVFWTHAERNSGIQRCDGADCRLIFSGDASVPVLSPDDARVAFLSTDNGGHVVRWIAADGAGHPHEITRVDGQCPPVWSNVRDVWVALLQGSRVVWTEFDTDTARPTGRTSPGVRNCSDGYDDPAAPGERAIRIENAFRSQLRLLPEKYLPTD